MSEEVNTLGRMLRASCRTWKDKAAQIYPSDGSWKTVTYTELWEKARAYAGALQSLGLKKGDRVAIQSENRIEWSWVDWGCQCLGVVLVPIYPTLPADQAQYIVQNSGAKVVIAGDETQAEKARGLPEVRVIQLFEGAESMTALAESHASDLEDQELNASIDSVGPQDVATFIYTSGTTGPPKGAMLAQESGPWLLANVVKSLPIDHRDTFLTFLPMSHVFERVAGQWLPISCGATCAYSKGLLTLANDLMAVKPTILLCVPRFLEATRDKILDGTKKAKPLQRRLLAMAMSLGVKKARGGFAPFFPILNAIVGKKIRARVGGNIRFFVSGGAALPPPVAEFYMAFGLHVLQGYGLTETTAASSVNHPDRSKYWTVGEPIAGVEIKLAEDGEILIRGKSVMLGYHSLPKETAEAIDAEGWFHSGDIGEWEGKHLKITDRKKDLLILANGKNVAPQPIENRLKESPWIQEAVLFGDGKEYVFGLIVPNFERLAAKYKDEGRAFANNHAMAEDEAVKALLKDEISGINKGLADFEKVKRYALVDASFSVETGELTPSLKVKRKVVKEKFAEVLKDLS
ncbi:MAG: long-chain fatty acid--CoA ligase [Armatimonadetes bacterium]|nr:long-chain fatty acid--CoA ligase [Armatimonadota bacterium]